jgi:hypothetical protein
MGSEEKKNDKVRIIELENNVGEAQELPPQERARLVIAGWVLGVLAIIFVLAGGVMIFGPECRLAQAKEVFDFVKIIAPPIATLVIGFYFRSESA